FADKDRCTRNGRKDRIGERGDCSVRATIGLEFGKPDIGDLEYALSLVDGELDRHSFYRHDLANQFRELRDGPAELACINFEYRLLLRVRSTVVDIDCSAKVALQHVSRDGKCRRYGTPSHVDAVDAALVEMPRLHRVTGAVIGILANPAGAQDAT